MTPCRDALTDIEPYEITVLMADGFRVQCTERGIMRVAIHGIYCDDPVIIVLMDTLLVPGLDCHLISVPTLNASGIPAQFDADHAILDINGYKVYINDPYHRAVAQQPLPFTANVDSQPSSERRVRFDVPPPLEDLPTTPDESSTNAPSTLTTNATPTTNNAPHTTPVSLRAIPTPGPGLLSK